MTVAVKTSEKVYVEDGVTLAFSAPFRILNASDLLVQRIATDGTISTLVLGVNYAVGAGSTDTGRMVTLVSSVAGARLRIRRVTARSQMVDYQTNDNFPAESHEGALDRAMLIDQEQDVAIADLLNRALAVPDGESVAALPTKASRAGKFLAFDANGVPIPASGGAGDSGLRTDMAAASGSSLVGNQQAGIGAAIRSVGGKLAETKSLDDYILAIDASIGGYWDATNAFARAAAAGTVIYGTPGVVYYVKDVVLDGRQFDGRACILRDAPGAKFGIRLRGYAPAASNFFVQDQGNYVASTTLSAGAAGGATTAQVASAAGIEIGQVFFVDLDANEIRWQSFVTNVVGTTITFRDAIPSAAAAGKSVTALRAFIEVGDAEEWVIDKVLVINGNGALLTMPPTGLTSNKGSLTRFSTSGAKYFGWIKAGDAAGIKANDVKLWCGYVDTFNYTGSGIAGPYSFNKKVFLTRDVTVTVGGVAKAFGTHWTYSSQTGIQFTPGNFPGVGAAIVISHFRDGYRGMVDDQRNTSIISGGNVFTKLETLDAFLGTVCLESELTEFVSLNSDTCQYAAMQLSGCTNTLVFSGETFLGFSGSSLKVYGSNVKCIPMLYTYRVPLSYTWLPTQDDNIYQDATSVLRISAAGWTGEFQNTVVAGGKFDVLGSKDLTGRNSANLTAGATVYLADNGAFAAAADASQRAPIDGTLKKLTVTSDTAPGAGQTYTIDILVAGASQGQVVLSGAAAVSGQAILNTYVAEGTLIQFRLAVGAAAAVAARINVRAVIA